MFTPEEIRRIEFEKVMRGYRPEDVEAFLDKVASNIEAQEKEKRELEDQLFALAEKVEALKGEEENIKKTLISAQKLGESIISEAHQKADLVLKEAQIKKNSILADAHEEHNYYESTIKRLKHEVSEFRETILTLYKTHIESLSTLPKEEKPEEVANEENIEENTSQEASDVKEEENQNSISNIFEE